MQSSLKRMLSLMLSLVLVLSCVPATVFATEASAAAEGGSSDVALNTTTGETYTSVTAAALAAGSGETVQLTQNATDTTVTVFEGVTLDLNGYTLEAGYVTCYGDLIDSSEDNTGLLVVPQTRFMIQTDNAQLPVRDGTGYRFVEVTGFNATMVQQNKYAFQPLFEAAAHQYLALGADVTGISIHVNVTWKQGDGTRSQQFIYNDSLVNGYIDSYKSATGSYGKMFTLTHYSVGNYEDLTFEAQVFSDTDVSFGAGESYADENRIVLDEDNRLVNAVTVYHTRGTALIPAGTLMVPGTTMELTAVELANSGSDVTLGNGEELLSLDVHISGISEDNDVPAIITLNDMAPEFLNRGNLALYHVEDGVTVPMTRVYSLEEVDAHNEYYYDIITGTVTVALASFSEIASVSAIGNSWKGKRDYSWYNTTDTEFVIANADQLAGLSAIVGGMDGKTPDSFKGKTVKLIADIKFDDMDSENGYVFYPIGYYNSEGTYTKTNTAITSSFNKFEGTFDGQGHVVSDFYQNTWEMKGDHNWYDATLQYYRDGMGLFGKVYGGTVKNLTIKNFESDGEITTTGCVAAYADCGATFENIAIFNCNPRVYNIGNGGIVGCVGWYANDDGTAPVTFRNITVDNTNKISALWGSWDVPCGGIVGQYYPTSGQSNAISNPGITFENCHVAAQIDVYNDVCANYQYYAYRYSGMLIGSVRENVTGEDGRVYPKMDGITASGCTVHFGDWNDYYYCELVANSLASYTHDHQMSRLLQVTSVNTESKTVTLLDDTEAAIPDSGSYNYVVVKNKNEQTGKWVHGDGTVYATCYHFVNGVVWDHASAGKETVNGQEVLKEDKTLVYLEFNNLVTGYGWGVTTKAVNDLDGVEILDYSDPTAVQKFMYNEGITIGMNYNTGAEVSLGDLFKVNPDLAEKLAIDVDNVQVFVYPIATNDATDSTLAGGTESTAGAKYTADKTDWTKSTLEFYGHGTAEIVITDYYYCVPTYLYVNIEPAMNLEVVAHPVNTYDDNHSEGTKVYLQLTAGSELTLAEGSTVSVPISDEWKHYTYAYTSDISTIDADGVIKVSKDQTVNNSKDLVLGTFLIKKADVSVDELEITENLLVKGTAQSFKAQVTTTQGTGHDDNDWTAWTDETTLPSKTGKYYLTTNVTLATQQELNGKNGGLKVELCLNGYTVTANADHNKITGGARDRIYSVTRGAILTICDCTACMDDATYYAKTENNEKDPGNEYLVGKLTGASQGALIIPTLSDATEQAKTQHAGTVINVYDAVITGNELVQDSATILAQMGATVNMYGGLITGNTNKVSTGLSQSGGFGAGIYAGSKGTFNVYGGWITNNTANRGAAVWCVSGSLYIENAVITGNKTWKDSTDAHQRSEDDANFDATTAATGDDVEFSYADTPLNGSGGAAYISTGLGVTIKNTRFEDNEAWIRGGAIYLAVKDGAVACIENCIFNNNKALTAKYLKDTTVLPDDTNEEESGEETPDSSNSEVGGSDSDEDVDGDDVNEGDNTSGGTTVVSSERASTTGSGGAIYITASKNVMITDCTFTNNYASLASGAIGLMYQSTVILENVDIRGNSCGSNGGAGVYIAGSSNLTIQGEETVIKNNYTRSESYYTVAGVYITNAYSTLTIKGSPMIFNNGQVLADNMPEDIANADNLSVYRPRNVYLQDNEDRTTTETITNEDGTTTEVTLETPNPVLKIRNLTAGASINVFRGNSPKDPVSLDTWLDWKDKEGFDAGNTDSYYGTWLFSYLTLQNYSNYKIWENTSTKELELLINHNQLTDHKAVTGEATAAWQPWYDSATLPSTGGYYYLMTDVNPTVQTRVTAGNTEITLCLNGHTIDASNSTSWGSVYYIKGKNNKLTICDCTAHTDAEGQYIAGGIQNAGNTAIATPGGTNDDNSETVITLRGGIYKNNSNVQTTDSDELNHGGLICAQKYVNVNIVGGLYDSNKALYGGAIYLTDGTLTVTGATFTGNFATTNSGGAIRVGSAKLNISGTTFTDNRAVEGGAIYGNNSTVTVTDYTIFNGNTGTSYGGAVHVSGKNGTLDMSDVIIENCRSIEGSAIRFVGTTDSEVNKLSMTNVRIQNCTSLDTSESIKYNVAVHVQRVRTVSMTSCTVTGNTTKTARGTVFLYGDGYRMTATLTDCTFSDNLINADNDLTAAIYVMPYTSLVLSGNNVFSGNANSTKSIENADIYLQNDNQGADIYPTLKFVNIAAGSIFHVFTSYLWDSNSTGLDQNSYMTADSSQDAAFFVEHVRHTNEGGIATTYLYNVDADKFVQDTHASTLTEADYHYTDLVNNNDTGTSVTWEPVCSATTLPSTSGYYYLTQDITMSARINIDTYGRETTDGYKIVLCLNGHNITSNDTAWASIYRIYGKNHSLTICDCTATGNALGDDYSAGKVVSTKNFAIGTPSNVSGTTAENAGTTIRIRDGIFTGTTTTGSGGVICAQEQTSVQITGGQFVDSSAQNGGAIYVNNGTLSIENALFKNNKAVRMQKTDGSYGGGHGGAIYTSATTVTIANTTIAENSAHYCELEDATEYVRGGGIYISEKTTLTLNGSVTINDNMLYSSSNTSEQEDIYCSSLSTLIDTVVDGYGANVIGYINKEEYIAGTNSSDETGESAGTDESGESAS